jgi:four helix bundle protein
MSKPYDIRERTMLFALRVLEISGKLPENREGDAVREQFVRAGTSIGANVEEADGAISKADKRRSLVIARKECRETRYWLNLIGRKWGPKDNFNSDIGEATEILYIPSSIISKLE